MKKLLFTLSLLSLVSFANAQITSKAKTVYTSYIGSEKMVAHFFYENDSLVDVTIQFMGHNNKYTKIIDIIEIVSGTPSEVCYLFSKAIELIQNNKEDGISITVNGKTIRTVKSFGAFGVYIFTDNGSGWHAFSENTLQKAKDNLVVFCKENNINISCDTSTTSTSKIEKQKTEKEDKYDKLKKLKSLLDDGIITQEEFDKEKAKILEN